MSDDSRFSGELAAILADSRRRVVKTGLYCVLAGILVGYSFGYTDFFDYKRYQGAARTIVILVGEGLPPDFQRYYKWGKPVLETLAMSLVGTVLACAMALPLGAAAAKNLSPAWLTAPVRVGLNVLRSIPSLIWGVMFVAALGFGPLPGIFALAVHSAGMLGKFYAEILEHVDPAPSQALKSYGVSWLGVARYAIWPQIMPRILDVSIYRFEHNLRSTTTLGVVGAGGLGLEIVTAFHLFEYSEAMALIAVLFALVTFTDYLGGKLRGQILKR